VENPQKIRCNTYHRHCATHYKLATKKTGDSSNVSLVLVCTRVVVKKPDPKKPPGFILKSPLKKKQ